MTVTDIKVTFSPHHVLKHSKPGKKLDSFHYKTYYNKKSCFVGCLKEYLNCRNIKVQTDNKALLKTFQGSGNRFIEKMGERTFHRNVHSETSTPHTCRSAATRKSRQLSRHCQNFKTGLLEKCQNIL